MRTVIPLLITQRCDHVAGRTCIRVQACMCALAQTLQTLSNIADRSKVARGTGVAYANGAAAGGGVASVVCAIALVASQRFRIAANVQG